jgi:hypothetical protein
MHCSHRKVTLSEPFTSRYVDAASGILEFGCQLAATAAAAVQTHDVPSCHVGKGPDIAHLYQDRAGGISTERHPRFEQNIWPRLACQLGFV